MLVYVTCLIHTPWLIHMWHDAFMYERNDSFIRSESWICDVPLKKLLGGRFSTPYPVFCLICTINSKLKCFPALYHSHVSRGQFALVSSGRVWPPLDSKKLFVWTHLTHSDVTWRIYMWHVSFIRRDSFICYMTHSYDSFICDMTHPYTVTHAYATWPPTRRIHIWHDSFICDTAHPYAVTHSYFTWFTHVWHESFISDMMHSYVIWSVHMWHDSFIYDISDMTHSYAVTYSYVTWLIHMWRFSFNRDMPIRHVTYEWETSHTNESCHIWMSHDTHGWVMSHMNASCESCHIWLSHGVWMWQDSFIRDMTHSYVTWLIHMWHDSSICDMTHLYVTWLIYTSMWHDLYLYFMTLPGGLLSH